MAPIIQTLTGRNKKKKKKKRKKEAFGYLFLCCTLKQRFFHWRISPNFDQEKYNFDLYTKDFSWKKKTPPHIRQILKGNCFPNRQSFVTSSSR
jgi:hypothetical protein